MKISIVIPTLTLSLVEKCVESVIKYTDLDDTEIIIVYQGKEECNIKLLHNSIKLLNFEKPLGVTRAYNEGIKASTGDYILLLNDDCAVLDSPKNFWIDELLKPFENKKVAATGPFKMIPQMGPNVLKLSKERFNYGFLIFFCTVIPKKIFNEIGLLDESLRCGIDIDFCMKLYDKGYMIKQVPEEEMKMGDKTAISTFPFFHKGEGTVHDFYGSQWEKILKEEAEILSERYGRKDLRNVTAYITTKDRYFTTLPTAIAGIIGQTIKPKEFILIDDGEQIDLRENPVYKCLFQMLDESEIEWRVIFGFKKGQVFNHQMVLQEAKYDLIWRIDDDNFPEANVLETLLDKIQSDNKIGAVASRSVIPNYNVNKDDASSLIEDIYTKPNIQWSKFDGWEEVDHLHNSFLYRKEAGKHGYHMGLSSVGHREETIFSYDMKLNGWKLYVNGEIITWHLRQPQGGIRSYNNYELYEHDEKIFKQWMKARTDKIFDNTFIAVLDNGIGDHYEFAKLLPEIKDKYENIIIASCYPDIFEDKQIKQISITEAVNMFGNVDRYNIYRFMEEHNWKTNMVDAYRTLYKLI